MKDALATAVVDGSKAIDNSQIVREVDPRSSRDLAALLALVGVIVVGLALYAWPHMQLRETTRATELLNRQREKLIEENRKLRLEKSSLENLRRVESIATRQLGMLAPPPERVIVVERAEPIPEAARLARGDAAAAPAERRQSPRGARD